MPEKTIKRKIRPPRKLNRSAVLAALERGSTAMAIASEQGVAASTVTRFLHQIKEQHQSLVEFRARRADILADLQLRASLALHRCLDALEQIEELRPTEMARVAVALRHILQVCHDQERLERGESTENIKVLATVVHESVKSLYKESPSVIPLDQSPIQDELTDQPSAETLSGDTGSISASR